jgi:hypothetical protein
MLFAILLIKKSAKKSFPELINKHQDLVALHPVHAA